VLFKGLLCFFLIEDENMTSKNTSTFNLIILRFKESLTSYLVSAKMPEEEVGFMQVVSGVHWVTIHMTMGH
jgi:hypothetical protein